MEVIMVVMFVSLLFMYMCLLTLQKAVRVSRGRKEE